jgi:hypothetical protein
MRRGDRILFEESFEVRPGQNIVRVAWNPDAARLRNEQAPSTPGAMAKTQLRHPRGIGQMR